MMVLPQLDLALRAVIIAQQIQTIAAYVMAVLATGTAITTARPATRNSSAVEDETLVPCTFALAFVSIANSRLSDPALSSRVLPAQRVYPTGMIDTLINERISGHPTDLHT